MYIFYRTLLCIAYFGIILHCTGETSNSNGNGLDDNGGIFCSSVNCRQHTAIVAGSIVGGGTGMILLLIGTLICCRRCKGRPSQKNSTFVNTTKHKNNKHELYDITLFKSGIWSSRCLQFGIWYGPHCFPLSFDSRSFKVIGTGLDNIGMFTIDGTYSIRTGRIGLTKTYQLGTRNQTENVGHHVIIQLIWNSETRQFEGKWYARTKKYRGEGRFELKFSRQQKLFPSEKV